jgi:hypothetical protein
VEWGRKRGCEIRGLFLGQTLGSGGKVLIWRAKRSVLRAARDTQESPFGDEVSAGLRPEIVNTIRHGGVVKRRWKMEDGGWKMEDGRWRIEDGG